LAVGAPATIPTVQGVGTIYVYDADPKLVATLKRPNETDLNTGYGTALAFDGNWLVVGAPMAIVNNAARGAAFAFNLVNGSWVFSKKLTAPDGAAGNEFGRAVSISGNHILVGARRESADIVRKGAVYEFKWESTAWNMKFKLMARKRFANDYYGQSVWVHNGEALIGAPFYDEVNLDGVGSVFHYPTLK
jgi:hypothetical protein